MYYLKRKVTGRKFKLKRDIPDIVLKNHSPSEVREMSYPKTKDLEGFFFCSLGSKYSNGQRKNCSSKCGYWKATGKDKAIYNKSHKVGKRRTLTFYRGKAKGTITDWHIHEYRLEDKELPIASNYQNEFVVLCKIFEKKSRGPKTDEEYESPVEEDADDCVNGDDENGSLVSFLFAIQSSSMGPEEGQNTVATISALNIENGQDTVLQPLPPHTATTIVPQHHPSPPENDVHKLLLNVSDEDGDTCDGGGSSQVDSVPNKSTGEDVDTNDINATLVDIIDSWKRKVLSQGLPGGFLEEEDLNKPMEDGEG
ncbi:hypothetical protein AAC387_Pa07g0279 [Persea americana]